MMWTEHARRDVCHAWRTIVRMPGHAAVVILSLGVGIGVNTAVFSWIQAVVFQPLPGVADAASFHLVESRAETGSYAGVSWLEYRDLQERLRSFRGVVAFRMVPLNVGEPARTERTYGLFVSGNYFSALGLRPALGRFLRPEEVAHTGSEPVVVISHEFWQTRFSGAARALGQTVRVNDRPLTIVGVAPERFQGTVLGLNFDLWVPATLAPVLLGGSRELEDRGVRGYAVMGKLQPHVTRAQAQAEVDAAMRQLAQIYPETNATMRGEVLPFWQAPRGPQRMLARGLVALQAVMLLLLLAVCGNTANLVLARAGARHREVGVRLALGAGPWRVVSLVLTENLVLALLGAGLGAAFAVWGTEALRAAPLTGALPIKFQTSVDAGGLAFAMLLGVACGLIFGVPPAVQLARADPQAALRSGFDTPARHRSRNALMGVEVALALVVLVAAALFFRSFSETRETDPGFRREGVLLAAYDLTGRNVDNSSARAFATRLLDRLRALPGVEAAAIASSVPLDIHGLPLRSFALEGRTRNDGARDRALNTTITPGYFRTMGIPLRAGSDFADLHDTTTAPQAIVNEEFVRRYLDGAEPVISIGRRLEARGRSHVIAGVVRNSLYESFGEPPTPIVYFSYRDRPAPLGEVHLRTRVGAETLLASEVRRVVRELDPALPTYDVRTLSEHIEKNLFLRRIPARMFVVLGPLLLVLAAIGIYAVVAYTVSHRTTEIGVRLALGAPARRAVAGIVGDSLRVTGIGALAGWLIALVVDLHVGRGLVGPRHEVAAGGSIDLPIFLGVPVILLLVATVACWLPAHRATKVDPMVSLRHE
ncbi:MAG: ABC transporter permease [Acidobacteria bacterium]|nr:ABC transporter permease [Acidobacteriota bacterium]